MTVPTALRRSLRGVSVALVLAAGLISAGCSTNPAGAAFNRAGVTAFREGKPAEALGHFNRAIAEVGDYPYGLNNRGLVNYLEGNYSDSWSDYTRAIELTSGYENPHSNRGVVNHNRGADEMAMIDFDSAIRMNDDHPEAWFNRARIHMVAGDYDQALRDVTTAIAEYKQDGRDEEQWAQAIYLRGIIRRDMGDIAGAAEDFREAEKHEDKFKDLRDEPVLRRHTPGKLGG